MKDEVLTVMILRAGELMPEVKAIPHELEKMQELVGGGYFDIVRGEYMLPPEFEYNVLSKYDIFVNDEGIMRGMEPNICLNHKALKAGDYDHAGLLFGDIFLARHDGEGDTISIDHFDIDRLRGTLCCLMLMNKSRRKSLEWQPMEY